VPLGFDALLIQPFFPIKSGFDTHQLICRSGQRQATHAFTLKLKTR
jgi:hypothetical protein